MDANAKASVVVVVVTPGEPWFQTYELRDVSFEEHFLDFRISEVISMRNQNHASIRTPTIVTKTAEGVK